MEEGVPGAFEDVAAVAEELAVFGEDFEGDGAVVAPGLEGFERVDEIEVSGAEGEVEVGVAAFVVVDVDVFDAGAVGSDDFGGGVGDDLEIAVADVEVEAEFGDGVEEFAELGAGVEFAGDVFDHQADAVVARGGEEFADGFDVLFDDEMARMKGGVAIRMEIHPLGADFGEEFDAAFAFLDGGAADGFEGAGERKIVRGVANDAEAEVFEGGANFVGVNFPRSGGGGFESKIDKIELEFAHPFHLREDVAPRIVHRPNLHTTRI